VIAAAGPARTAGHGTGLVIGPADAERFGLAHYDTDVLPSGIGATSLGCGNPVEVADLRPGETVLDLGSGGGLDVLLSAHRVGPTVTAIGLDMTEEMLDLARHHATQAGATNVKFLTGRIENILLPDNSVDVVISNCVIALSADKTTVFTEIARVLRPRWPDRDHRHPRRRHPHRRRPRPARRESRIPCWRPHSRRLPVPAGHNRAHRGGIRPTHPAGHQPFSAIIRATKSAVSREFP
jgi:SAM-dependent methyltransferase